MEKIIKSMEKANRGFAYIGMAAAFFVMIMMVIDIILRNTVEKNVLGSYEMTEMAMVIIIFLGIPWTQSLKGHVKVPMFVEMLPKKVQYFLDGIVLILTAAFTAFMTYAAFTQAAKYATDGATTAVLLLPYSPFGYIFAFGMLLFTITLLFDAIGLFVNGSKYKGAPAVSQN